MIRPLLLLGAALLAPGASAQTAAAPPSLVVLITVDGLTARHLDDFGPQLEGGLARLTRNGAWFTNAHHDHAITETAPGHASLLSGRFPRSTGIAANRVGVVDPQAPLVGSGNVGASPARFQGTTLFDWMKRRTSGSRALSVSAKDRGAILPIGRAKEEVYWYPGDGAFRTSTYYRAALPEWVTRFNDRRIPHSYAGKTWDLLRPASDYAEPDSVAVEGGGNEFLFPHQIPDDPQRAANWIRATPFIDEVTVAFALEGVSAMQLGAGPQPDRLIGVFLDSLFRLRDSSKVVVVFSADHGFTRIPELAGGESAGGPTRASLDDALAAAHRRMAELRVEPTALDVDQQIVLADRAAFLRAGAKIDVVLDEFIKAALATPGIARVDRLSSLLKDTLADPIARRWAHQFGPGTNVELVATQTPGTLWTSTLVASHGSPYDTDSRVPVIFYGSGFTRGRFDDFVRTVDIAPTLATLLKLKPAGPVDGITLRKALK